VVRSSRKSADRRWDWSELTVPVDPYQVEDPYVSTGVAVYAPQPSPTTTVRSGQSRPVVGRGVLRAGVWAVPGAAGALAVTAIWTAPRPGHPPNGATPGVWLIVTVVGLILAVLGVLSLTGLLAPTRGRRWALASLMALVVGTVLVAPALGVVGLGYAAADQAGSAAAFQASLAGGVVLRWLGLGGLALLALGWSLLGVAVAASRLFTRSDAILVLLAVLLAIPAVRVEPLLVLAAITLLAAGLGLAWTATRTRI
jgi:hypothetical protein